jgi:predicted anti-sigma-YlaC factor YlaD
MIKCNEVITELEAYRRNEISTGLKKLIDAHLDTCSSCRQELDSLRQLDKLLDNYQMASVTTGFAVRFRERLENEYTRTIKYFTWRKIGLVASVAVVLVAVIIWIINPFSSLPSSTEKEIINNLDMLEDLETVQMMDVIGVDDYELVEVLPEIMDMDLNGH